MEGARYMALLTTPAPGEAPVEIRVAGYSRILLDAAQAGEITWPVGEVDWPPVTHCALFADFDDETPILVTPLAFARAPRRHEQFGLIYAVSGS